MAFPLSPTNNQVAIVNGIEYYYNSTKGAWYRYGDATANVITSNTFQVLSSVVFADGTSQTTAATGIDVYARTTANTNATNITIIQGVDTTQNTSITAADTKAQASFDAANTKFSSSGGTITGDTVVTGNLTVTGTQFYANTVNLTVVDNIITLNSNVTGAPSLSAGIEVNRGSSTNTKIIWSEANTSWEFTNNGTTYDKIAGQEFVNAAFSQANTISTLSQAAFDSSNTSSALQSGINATQNTNITTATVLAQAAFDAANTVSPLDAYARTTANTATDNIVILQGVNTTQNTNITGVDTKAQAAFDKANTSAPQVNTTNTAPPSSANSVGDIWYNTSDDVTYRYTYDGTSYYWIDISGGTIVANTAASSIMTLNKTIGISMVFGG